MITDDKRRWSPHPPSLSFWSDVRPKSRPRTLDHPAMNPVHANKTAGTQWQNSQYLMSRAKSPRRQCPEDLVSSLEHVLWLIPGFVLKISFSVSVITFRVSVRVRDIRFLWKKRGRGGSSCQINAPARAFIQTCICYTPAKWQATNGLLFPFTRVSSLHFCLLRSGVRLQRLLCGHAIGGISLQACAFRRCRTFCLRFLKMHVYLSEHFRLRLS